MPLTHEQEAVVEAALNNTDDVIAVDAKAGSGKSSTAKAIVEAVKPKDGFYCTYNKAILEDTKKRMGNLITCKTIHALAYKYCKPKKGLEELTYQNIKEDISYDSKAQVINILDKFCRSSSTDLGHYLEDHCNNEELHPIITQYANNMLEDKIPCTFNFMLKKLHILLLDKNVDIHLDLVIFDECQDVTAVSLEIFKLINAKKKVILGDTHQNIYSFMDTVNAFRELDNLSLLRLTKSFRCNEDIASRVQLFGRKHLEPDFKFTGNSEVVPGHTPKVAFITRTNAALIARMSKLIESGKSFTLTRGISEIFSLPTALLNASKGNPVYDKKYKYFETEYKNYSERKRDYINYYDYLLSVTEDPLLEYVIKLLSQLSAKKINIFTLKEKALNLKPDKDIVLTTAHAFKGLEADAVFLEDDLNSSVNRAILRKSELDKSAKEDLNTYYVAMSRAKTKLLNERYV